MQPSQAEMTAVLSQLTHLTLPTNMLHLSAPSLRTLTLETCDLSSLPDLAMLPALRVFCVNSLVVKPCDVSLQGQVVDAAVQALSSTLSFECSELCLVGEDTLQATGAGAVFIRRVLPLLQGVRSLSLLRVALQPQQLLQFAGLASINELKLFKCSVAVNVLSEACAVFPGLDKISIICKALTLPSAKECMALLEQMITLRIELGCHTYCSDDRQVFYGFKEGFKVEEECGVDRDDLDEGMPGVGTHPRAALACYYRGGAYSDSEQESEMLGQWMVADDAEWQENEEDEEDGSDGVVSNEEDPE